MYGWFKRYMYWPDVSGWVIVEVRLRKKIVAMLDEVWRGTVWLPPPTGTHAFEFYGFSGRLHAEALDLAQGQQVFIAFRPLRWLPFRTPPAATWCHRDAADVMRTGVAMARRRRSTSACHR